MDSINSNLEVKFLGDGFRVYRAKFGKPESTLPGYDIFILAPDILTALAVASNHEVKMIQENNECLGIELVADCILDGRK